MKVQSLEDRTKYLEALRAKFETLEKAKVAGVVGIDKGYRYKDGVRKDEECYRVFLEGPKIPPGQLDQTKDIATVLAPDEVDVIDLTAFDFPREGVPPTLGGNPDPVASGRLNPIQPGISVSHFGQGAGTMGLIVYRKKTGEPALLSCAHVIAGQFARRNDRIFQPAVLDGGEPDFDAIGYLENWFVDEDGDAAIANLNRSRMRTEGQFSTEQKLLNPGWVKLGDLVEKSGRGSGVTQALVDGIGLYRMTLAGFAPRLISGFRLVPRNPLRSVEISRPGDSGAVWYRINGSTEGVGLHIDGEMPRGDGTRHPEYAIACHLPRVLERLDVTMTWPEEARDAAGGNDLPRGPGGGRDAARSGAEEDLTQGGPAAGTPEPSSWPPDSDVEGIRGWIQRNPVQFGEVMASLAHAGTNGSTNGGDGTASAPQHP